MNVITMPMNIDIKGFFRFLADFVKRNLLALLLIAAVAVFLLLAFGDLCLSRVLFGLPCPACGMTRAVLFLTFLDLEKSLYYNPLAIPALLFILAFAYLKFKHPQKVTAWLFYPFVAFVIVLFVVFFYRLVHYSQHEALKIGGGLLQKFLNK